MTAEDTTRVTTARRGLFVFFAVVLTLSALFEGSMIRAGKPITEQTLLVILLMWTPAFGSLVARLVVREGVRDVSFRFGGVRGLRALAIAWWYPLLVGGVAYGAAWSTGLATFVAPKMAGLGLASASPVARFAALLVVTCTVLVPLSAITAAGEELGWRGYMLTRLIDAQVSRPVLVSGVVWGLWHCPLIISGIYAAGPRPLLSAGLFMGSVIAAAYVVAWARLSSGSIWPAIAFHAAWNAIIQGLFDASTKGGSSTHTTSIWIGESGVLVVLTGLAVAAWVSRGTWEVRHFPADPSTTLDRP